MDGGPHSLPSSSSASASASSSAEEDSSPQSDSALLQSPQEYESNVESRVEEVLPVGERLLSGEEQVTLITESMTVTSADQEKLLLLNKNTELRRVNKELMKLNGDWDQVYRTTTIGLQQRVESLEQENSAIKQLNNRLLLKIEHEQSAREYYEQTLIQELKKNHDLQEYIRTLESRLHHIDTARDWPVGKPVASLSAVSHSLGPFPSSDAPGGPTMGSSHRPGQSSPVCLPTSSSTSSFSSSPEAGLRGRSQSTRSPDGGLGWREDSQQEVQDLKEQLEALKCQTEIYEADYQTEQKDHKQTLQENRRLRRKREDMHQQVALLQEQLKVYEDDFRRERSDKQMLQRLLLKKTPPTKDPVLIHRCNNERQPAGGDKRKQREELHRQHHPLCPKHCDRNNVEFP